MSQIRDTAGLLRAARIVPVLTVREVAGAVPLARALVAGGVRTLEITLRTEAGARAADAIMDAVPEAIVGLGTVLTRGDVDLARRMGIVFAVSPGATPELLDAAAEAGLAFVPGIATASDYMAAAARGFRTVKLFPAGPLGGIATIKALGGPFPDARFCPTGGIGEREVGDYLAVPSVVAVGGSWLAPADEVAEGRWDEIEARARRAMAALGENALGA